MNTAMIKLILITVLVLVGVGGVFYVSNMQANLAVAKENQAKLEQAVVAQQEALSTMKADVAKQQVINQQLAKATEDQNKDMKDLEGKFKTDSKGEKRNIGDLATKKPELIEEKVNRGSVNAVRCLELATGAPLNEKEKNAKTAKDFNSECPSYFNPAN